MDKIRQWAILISSVTIISGVLVSLLPKGSHKNLYKTIIGIVILYAFIQPVMGGNDIDFKVSDFLIDNYGVSENIDKYALLSMVSSAERAIENLLSEEAIKNNIECSFTCKCKVENEQIVVDEITVKNLKAEDYQRIKDVVRALGLSENIIKFTGENQ